MAPKYRWFLVAFLIAYPLDLLTKTAIVNRFYYGERYPVIAGFFDLTHVRNPGGAFSFLAQGAPEWRLPFFIVTGCVAIGLLFLFLVRHEPDARVAPFALGAILGGALGNLTDRIVYGEVIDFLDFTLFGGYRWPTFNFADCAVVVGVAVLMVEIFFGDERGQAADRTRDTAVGEST
jgi:signal peptidase II